MKMNNYILDSQAEIERLYAHSTKQFAEMLKEFAVAIYLNNFSEQIKLEENIATIIMQTKQLADMLGRKRILMEFDRFESIHKYQEEDLTNPVVPFVPFEEAITDLMTREPRLVNDYQEIAKVYSFEHGFALSRSTSQIMTKKVQNILVNAVQKGKPIKETSELIVEVTGFARAYADTIYRTNLNTAYNAGRLQQVKDPAIARIIPAFRFDTAGDIDVRPNHQAADGLIASINDPIWMAITPPLGFSCRCGIILMDKFTLERMNLINKAGQMKRAVLPRGAFPDPGFKYSPPNSAYGS